MSSLDNVMFMVSTPVQRALTLHSESGRSVIHGRTMKPCFSDSGISDLSSTCPDVTLESRTVREALFLWQWNLQHFRAVSRGDFDYLLIDFHQGPSAPLLESFRFFNFRPLTWKKTSQTISKTVILKRICPPPNKFIHHQAPHHRNPPNSNWKIDI